MGTVKPVTRVRSPILSIRDFTSLKVNAYNFDSITRASENSSCRSAPAHRQITTPRTRIRVQVAHIKRAWKDNPEEEVEVRHRDIYHRSRKMVKIGGEGEGRGKRKRNCDILIFPKQVFDRPLLPSGSNPMAGDFVGCGL